MNRKGFTLVELSIVLIIIGLIIGGVLKGTDMINSAKQKKFYNTFVKTWQVATNQYQDRTGQVLGDGTVNGGTAATTDGLRETVALSPTGTIQTRLGQIGLDVPVTNTGDSGSYSVEGKYVTSTVIATLQSQPVNGSNRNVFYMANVPTDVAMAIDTMVDGTADADSGDARISATTTTDLVDGATVLTWGDASAVNTVNMSILF